MNSVALHHLPWRITTYGPIQAGFLNAKTIGWLPTKARFAEVKEAGKNNWHEGMLIVEEWQLIEYAVGSSVHDLM